MKKHNFSAGPSILPQEVLKKASEAIIDFNMTLKFRPNFDYALFNRGIAKSMLNDYEGALPDYEQTLKLYPEYKKG